MFYRLSPTNALLDSDSFLEQWSDLGRAAVYASQNPGEFVKAVVNWEDRSAGRYGEWLGNLVPDALLAIGTAGAGTAASRSLRGAKELEELGGVAPGAKPPPVRKPRPAPANRSVRGPDGEVMFRTDSAGRTVVAPGRFQGTPRLLDPREVRINEESFADRARPGEQGRHGSPPPNVKTKREAGTEAVRVIGQSLEDFLGG